MTVSVLAKRCGLSRSTLLYYESIGLLRRPPRTAGNYRAYGDADLTRLQQIGVYRKVGLSLAAVRKVLDQSRGDAAEVLQRRVVEIDSEIETLRDHQRAILRLLGKPRALARRETMTKQKWVAIMRAAGFTEADMDRWHAEFEASAPEEHRQFLEYLRIRPHEIKKIRESSRKVLPAVSSGQTQFLAVRSTKRPDVLDVPTIDQKPRGNAEIVATGSRQC